MSLDAHLRLFGIYPLACASYQSWVNLQPNGINTLMNPRLFFGIPFAKFPAEWTVFCWATTVWLFLIAFGCLLGKGRFFIVVYWYAELVLAIPLLLWMGIAIFNHFGHVGPNEFLPQCFRMLLFFTVIPVVWAMKLGADVDRERRPPNPSLRRF